MSKAQISSLALSAVLFCAAAMSSANAQTAFTTSLTNIYSFGSIKGDGDSPESGLIRGNDGAFYGTTRLGGTADQGVIFRVTQDGEYAILHSFSAAEGNEPGALIQDANGTFYGTTSHGGSNTRGTVFRCAPDGTLTVLHTFGSAESEYTNSGLLRAADGTLYGVTEGGGLHGTGSVYKLTPQGKFIVLYSFGAANESGANSDGAFPMAALVAGPGGSFYGTTARGGSSGYGTAFKITPAGKLTVLHAFSEADGTFPQVALLLAADGNFYGAASGYFPIMKDGYGVGVNSGPGSIFRLSSGGDLTPLQYSRADYGHYGALSPLLQTSDGNLYGTLESGGYGAGNIFKIAPDGTYSVVNECNFYQDTGDGPKGGLVQGSDGNLYGAIQEGGARHYGGIFRLDFTPPTLAFTTSAITVAEQAGSVMLRVHRGGGSGAVSVQYATVDEDDAEGDAYERVRGTLVWADGDLEDKTITVPILDEGIYDGGTEFFIVDLTNATAGTLLLAPTGCRVNIRDVIVPTQPVTLAAGTTRVNVGSGETGVVIFSLPAKQVTDVVINYAVQGAAINGIDYQTLKGTTTIKAGKTSKHVKIVPLGGPGGTAIRAVKLTLLPGNGYTVDSPATVKVKLAGVGR